MLFAPEVYSKSTTGTTRLVPSVAPELAKGVDWASLSSKALAVFLGVILVVVSARGGVGSSPDGSTTALWANACLTKTGAGDAALTEPARARHVATVRPTMPFTI